MLLISTTVWLPLIVAVLIAPTIGVVWLAMRLGATSMQRLANLAAGLCCSLLAVIALGTLFEPGPNSWAETNIAFLVFGLAALGMAVGVAAAVSSRAIASRRGKPHRG